jgi:hypothetical protein
MNHSRNGFAATHSAAVAALSVILAVLGVAGGLWAPCLLHGGDDSGSSESIEVFAVGRAVVRVTFGPGKLKIERQAAGGESYAELPPLPLDLKGKDVTSAKGAAWLKTGIVLTLRVHDATEKRTKYYWATRWDKLDAKWAVSEIDLARSGKDYEQYEVLSVLNPGGDTIEVHFRRVADGYSYDLLRYIHRCTLAPLPTDAGQLLRLKGAPIK